MTAGSVDAKKYDYVNDASVIRIVPFLLQIAYITEICTLSFSNVYSWIVVLWWPATCYMKFKREI